MSIGMVRHPSVKYFKIFGSKCYIYRDNEGLGSFEARTNEGIFLGYSTNKKAYKCYNKRLRIFLESINAKIDE